MNQPVCLLRSQICVGRRGVTCARPEVEPREGERRLMVPRGRCVFAPLTPVKQPRTIITDLQDCRSTWPQLYCCSSAASACWKGSKTKRAGLRKVGGANRLPGGIVTNLCPLWYHQNTDFNSLLWHKHTQTQSLQAGKVNKT